MGEPSSQECVCISPPVWGIPVPKTPNLQPANPPKGHSPQLHPGMALDPSSAIPKGWGSSQRGSPLDSSTIPFIWPVKNTLILGAMEPSLLFFFPLLSNCALQIGAKGGGMLQEPVLFTLYPNWNNVVCFGNSAGNWVNRLLRA